jgi:hypothetical protein
MRHSNVLNFWRRIRNKQRWNIKLILKRKKKSAVLRSKKGGTGAAIEQEIGN